MHSQTTETTTNIPAAPQLPIGESTEKTLRMAAQDLGLSLQDLAHASTQLAQYDANPIVAALRDRREAEHAVRSRVVRDAYWDTFGDGFGPEAVIASTVRRALGMTNIHRRHCKAVFDLLPFEAVCQCMSRGYDTRAFALAVDDFVVNHLPQVVVAMNQQF